MSQRWIAVLGTLGLVALAAPAFADEASDLRQELDALKQRLDAQDRKVREMEGTTITQQEVDAAVMAYVGSAPAPFLVADDDKGSAGFPMGKKPFIKQGPNKVEFAFRNQVRWSGMFYSDDAVGARIAPAPVRFSGEPPNDRTGFEIERLYFGLDGTVFCEDITYKLELSFDSDGTNTVDKRYAYIDWKYAGEHHVRAGGDKVAFSCEENHSSSSLAFVDRSIVTKAFELGFDQGISLWGNFGDCDCPKRFMYKVQATNGEGSISRGSIFNFDAADTYSDQMLFAAMLEWNITCDDWKWDEVDHRPCEKRCKLLASLGASAYYENDDDAKRDQWGGLAVRGSSARGADRMGLNGWFRAAYNGWSTMIEWYQRDIDYTGANTSLTQTDSGAHMFVHYRFADSNWGLGVRAGILWLDDDYLTVTLNNQTIAIEDTTLEFGAVVNYFFHDHSNKVSLDVNYIQDNSGVSSSSAGYLANNSGKGVIVEDGIMVRLQWQLNF